MDTQKSNHVGKRKYTLEPQHREMRSVTWRKLLSGCGSDVVIMASRTRARGIEVAKVSLHHVTVLGNLKL